MAINEADLIDGSEIPDKSSVADSAWIVPVLKSDGTDEGGVTVARLTEISIGTFNAKSPRFGAAGDGVANDTLALKAFFEYCINNSVHGHIPAGTYLIDLGELEFDNGHVETAWPRITTDGHKSTIFKAASNTNAAFLAITNGTASSGVGEFWVGGFLGGLSFVPASGSVAGMPNMHGLVLRGIEECGFGYMSATGIGGSTVFFPQSLYAGTNPDPSHVNRCNFSGASGSLNLGATFYNDNYRGFAFCEVGPIFANGNANGALFGLGASNTFASVGAAFCGGWAVGDQPNSTGGASNGIVINAVEIDNSQNGVDTRNLSDGLTIGSIKIIHRFNTGAINTVAEEGYWPRIALRIGSTFRAVRAITFPSVEDRIEAGGTLADLGLLADFQNTGATLRDVTISRSVSDNASLGVTNATYFQNFNTNSMNVLYRTPRGMAIDTTKLGTYIRARNSGSVAIPHLGFATANNYVAYNTIVGGAAENYNTSTYTYTAPAVGVYRVQARLALALPAGSLVRMAIYLNTSIVFSSQSYAVTNNTEFHEISATLLLSIGQTIRINADQNSGAAVATASAFGGASDSFLAVEML